MGSGSIVKRKKNRKNIASPRIRRNIAATVRTALETIPWYSHTSIRSM
jgi:hypothetical protein